MIKTTNKDAIKIIQMERDHCALHNQDAGKDEEYHKEMQSLVDAFDLAIKALKEMDKREQEQAKMLEDMNKEYNKL